MASTIKVDNVQNQPGTNIINKCGTTITVGAACNSVAVTGNVVKSNALQASDAGNIISQSGTTVTLGASGDSIALASGATQTGFGRTGTVDWVTTPKVTGDSPITAVTGKGYFLNTTAGVITVNLPAGAAGSIVSMADYAGTWQTNNVTVAANGSEKIGGTDANAILDTEGQSVTLVYVDSTQGWINTMDSTSNVRGAAPFVVATGGNAIVTCGNFKTHIFTGPGTFCVSDVSGTGNPNVADYFVTAGGGGAGASYGGGGGAGGFRMSNQHSLPAPETSPLANPTGITVTASAYPITVGAGGAGAPAPGNTGSNGANSIFSSITSAGGGFSGAYNDKTGGPGGSGGGGSFGPGGGSGGTGNNPPVSPPQGNPGGVGSPGNNAQGGGGGAAASGGTGGPVNNQPGPGGIGSYIANGFVGPTAPTYGETGPVTPTRYFAGGGGGGSDAQQPGDTGGIGGGGSQRPCSPAADRAGGINMGGGAGGMPPGGDIGGSGIVMIRYKFQ